MRNYPWKRPKRFWSWGSFRKILPS